MAVVYSIRQRLAVVPKGLSEPLRLILHIFRQEAESQHDHQPEDSDEANVHIASYSTSYRNNHESHTVSPFDAMAPQ